MNKKYQVQFKACNKAQDQINKHVNYDVWDIVYFNVTEKCERAIWSQVYNHVHSQLKDLYEASII
jgi:hypothetical protein